MIEEVDKYYNSLDIDDLDMAKIMEEEVDSKSASQNGLWGIDVMDPANEKQGTIATQERPGTLGEMRKKVCSRHKQTISLTVYLHEHAH